MATIQRPAMRALPSRPVALRTASPAAPAAALPSADTQQSAIDAAVKSGQHMMTGGEIGAGVSLAAGVGVGFLVNPLAGAAVAVLGALAAGASFFLGLCKITAATD